MITICSLFSAMSWERRRSLPAPDPMPSVHPMRQHAVSPMGRSISKNMSTGFALQPTHTSMWLAPECKLQSLRHYFYDLHASSNDDDWWGDRSVGIDPCRAKFISGNIKKNSFLIILQYWDNTGSRKTWSSCTFSAKTADALAPCVARSSASMMLS